MQPILYFGDGDVSRAASYLSGVLAHFKIPFERINSDQSPESDLFSKKHSLYVLSDYPRERFRENQLEQLVKNVAAGAGLLMIGGWESYFGKNGEYHQSPLVEVLPVRMLDQDDRRNYAQPLCVRKLRDHEILDGLPWQTPPFLGGFNAITPKPDSKMILDAIRFDIRMIDEEENAITDCSIDGACELDGHPLLNRTTLDLKSGETMIISEVESVPLLVLGSFGQGRTAAFASDVAPHWVGGFVDWGSKRITQDIDEGAIEVGDAYARFFRNLVNWTAGSE